MADVSAQMSQWHKHLAGIGNGVSILITVGILARLPMAIVEEFKEAFIPKIPFFQTSRKRSIKLLIEFIYALNY